MANANALQWDGAPGHYEVYYLSATDPATGIGLWIRLHDGRAPEGEADCSLWFMAMDPDGGALWRARRLAGRAARRGGRARSACASATAELTDSGMRGGFDDVTWELRWEPGRPYEHVHPLLRRAGIAKTVLALPARRRRGPGHGDASRAAS